MKRALAPSALALLLAVAGCAGEGDAGGAAEESPRPRITAEHPVTSEPALAAGLWDGGSGGESPETALGRSPGADGAAGLVAMLPAPDVGAAVAFYTDLLGFDLVASEPASPPFRRAELARGDARLMLVEPARLARLTPDLAAASGGAGEPAEEGDEAGGEDGDDGAGDAAAEDDEDDEDGADEADDADDAASEDAGDGAASDAPTPTVRPVLRLALDDLDRLAEELTAAGVVAVERDDGPWGREIAVADPAGNRLLIVPADPD